MIELSNNALRISKDALGIWYSLARQLRITAHETTGKGAIAKGVIATRVTAKGVIRGIASA